jgi:hypothetical protein
MYNKEKKMKKSRRMWRRELQIVGKSTPKAKTILTKIHPYLLG